VRVRPSGQLTPGWCGRAVTSMLAAGSIRSKTKLLVLYITWQLVLQYRN
jgi:hypothetical protein